MESPLLAGRDIGSCGCEWVVERREGVPVRGGYSERITEAVQKVNGVSPHQLAGMGFDCLVWSALTGRFLATPPLELSSALPPLFADGQSASSNMHAHTYANTHTHTHTHTHGEMHCTTTKLT